MIGDAVVVDVRNFIACSAWMTAKQVGVYFRAMVAGDDIYAIDFMDEDDVDLLSSFAFVTRKRSHSKSGRPYCAEWRAIREKIFARDRYVCVYCGESPEYLECDHVIPISRGGTNDLSNLATACMPCNRSKSDRLLSEWGGR